MTVNLKLFLVLGKNFLDSVSFLDSFHSVSRGLLNYMSNHYTFQKWFPVHYDVLLTFALLVSLP